MSGRVVPYSEQSAVDELRRAVDAVQAAIDECERVGYGSEILSSLTCAFNDAAYALRVARGDV